MIWIDSHYFFAGVVFDERRVATHAAPILRYMLGWTPERVVAYAKRKRWKYGFIK